MATRQRHAVARVLRDRGFASPAAALNEIMLLSAANQSAEFGEACARCEEKYRMRPDAFARHLKRRRGEESFERHWLHHQRRRYATTPHYGVEEFRTLR